MVINETKLTSSLFIDYKSVSSKKTSVKPFAPLFKKEVEGVQKKSSM